jgi:signal transduction histidine kinase
MRPRRLFTRIYFHFIAVLVVVGLTFVGAVVSALRVYGHLFTERQAREAAELVAERWDDAPARAATVRHLADLLDVDVTLRAPSGEVLAQAGTPLPPLSARDLRAAQRGPTKVAGPGLWNAAAPVARGGAVVGVLNVCKRMGAHGPHFARPAFFVGIILLVVALGTAPLARRISRPVERLTEASRRLGGGDLSYRVPVRRNPWRRYRRHRTDELEELTRAWNEMADRVEGLVRGQKELLANVSHELRSPLARLRVALELLPRDAGNTRMLDDIGGDIVELDRLIEDVLTMSRLEATGLPARIDRVALRPMLAALVERAARDPAVAGRAVIVESGPEIEIVADGGLLKRALWNLVENAAKYGAPPITLAAARAGDRVRLSVTDEGGGIARADRERVFAPFYRGDKAHTPGTGGFGLGLALARRVAEVHGGTIRAEAARADGGVERGCRVVLELPVRPS